MNAVYEAKERATHNRALAAIHIAKSQLGMDDDTYRALLRRVSAESGREVESAARLNHRQMRAVLNEMRRLGAVRPGAHKPATFPGKPHNFGSPAMPEMIAKIEAQLADMKLSWAYADAIAKRQCGIARCAWVRSEKQLRGIIAALDVEQCKRGMNAFIDDARHKLGIGEREWAAINSRLPGNWRRSKPYLEQVSRQLQAKLEALDYANRISSKGDSNG